MLAGVAVLPTAAMVPTTDHYIGQLMPAAQDKLRSVAHGSYFTVPEMCGLSS